ncbi:MAG: hypothetical protein SVV03_04620 [Candidatus Nanohaloarchaea archaeon]|nr:hypothetical protein [Candidatus Nanohaloarchaea archaeon]
MEKLEEEMVESVNRFGEADEEEIERPDNNFRNEQMWLLQKHEGEFYTETARIATIYKISSMEAVERPRFHCTEADEDYYKHGGLSTMGELVYTAPESANACMSGGEQIVHVEDNRFKSPFSPERELGPVEVEEGNYLIQPIEFYNVELDNSQRYKREPRSKEDENGYSYWEEIVPVEDSQD